MCGIKWVVLRADENTSNVAEPLEDPVLSSFARYTPPGIFGMKKYPEIPRLDFYYLRDP